MRRIALVFVLITLISAAMRLVTPERIVVAALKTAKAPEKFRQAMLRVCLLVTKRLRLLLPQAN